MFDASGGDEHEVEALAAEIDAADVDGLTLLGGEPFEQAASCGALARLVRATGRSVMVFTGYVREELERRPDARALLAETDLLVDGPFDRTRPERTRRWIGSENQRIHHLTPRRETEASWTEGDQIVITLRRTALEVHGWPGARILGERR